MKAALIILVVGIMGIIAIFVLEKRNDSARKPGNVVAVSAADVVDYGNGVYYFAKIEADFGNALSAFIKSHAELEVVTITSNGTGVHGSNLGYFVIMKNK